MFRMNLPNQSADEQRKEVRRQVRNNVFSFIGLITLIRAGKFFSSKVKSYLLKTFLIFSTNSS